MLKVAMIAAVGALSVVGAAKAFLPVEPAQAAVAQTADLRGAETEDAAPIQASPTQVLKAPDGHFWAEADVNGSQVRFLVDTGATAVALTAADARRLGFDVQALAYDVPVHTASGEAKAARVKLASVSIGDARVEDVDAMVVDAGLSTSLLGMTYLGRLSRFEASQSALTLRP